MKKRVLKHITEVVKCIIPSKKPFILSRNEIVSRLEMFLVALFSSFNLFMIRFTRKNSLCYCKGTQAYFKIRKEIRGKNGHNLIYCEKFGPPCGWIRSSTIKCTIDSGSMLLLGWIHLIEWIPLIKLVVVQNVVQWKKVCPGEHFCQDLHPSHPCFLWIKTMTVALQCILLSYVLCFLMTLWST